MIDFNKASPMSTSPKIHPLVGTEMIYMRTDTERRDTANVKDTIREKTNAPKIFCGACAFSAVVTF